VALGGGMDQWAAHFQEKSERRRRRNRRSAIIRSGMIGFLLTAGIGAAFWATLTILDQLDSF